MSLAQDTVRDLMTLPGARPQDMTPEQVKAVRGFLDSSLFAFAYLVFGYTDLTPTFHGPVCQFLDNWGLGPAERAGGSEQTGWKRLALTIPRESFKCQDPDTLAHTPNGPVRLGDLRPGDTLFTVGDDLKLTTTAVIANLPGTAPRLRVKTQSGLIFHTTPNHPFRQLFRWTEAGQLRAGDFIATARSIPAPRPLLSEADNYLAGVVCGDGCWRGTTPTIESHDPEIITELRRLGFSLSDRTNGTTFSVLQPSSGKLPHSLQTLSINKRIPAKCEGSAAFLRGLFDTDGHVQNSSTKRAIVLTTSSEGLARDTQRGLRYFGICASVKGPYESQGPNGFRGTVLYVVISGRDDLVRYRDSIGFIHRAKAARLDLIISKTQTFGGTSHYDFIPPEWRTFLQRGETSRLAKAGVSVDNTYATTRSKMLRVANVIPRRDFALLANSDVFWDRITEVSPEGEGPIAQIEVSGDHSYLAGLALHHNTSLATRANALWQVARTPGHNPTVAIFNAKEDNASKWLKAIREVVEASHLLHICYPEMMPPGTGCCCLPQNDESRPKTWKWNNIEMQLARDQIGIPEASITALGIGGAATGGHWTHLIADDIIGLEESRSPAMMQAARDWIDAARFLERPAGKGNVLFVYTRWGYDDCYRYLLEKWPDEYVLFHRGALDDEGLTTERSAFPEKWSTEDLRRMRETDPYNYAAQMQSRPRAGRETAFDPTWNHFMSSHMMDDGDILFRIPSAHYDESRHELPPQIEGTERISERAPQEILRSQCDGALFWDPAPSEARDKNKDHRARNGKVVVFRDPWCRDFIPEARGTQMDPLDEMRDTIVLAAKWGVCKVAVEEVNFSKVYRHFAEYLLQKEFPELQNLIFFIKLKEERTQKDTRILGTMPRWRAGMIYFGEEAAPMLVEAREYPFGRTRDLLDGYAMDSKNKVLSAPLSDTMKKRIMLKNRHQHLMDGRDAITGY